MLSSFQNSNAFRCSCKANETQLLECSAKEETQLLFKGKGTRQITYPQRCVAQDARKSHQNFWWLILKNCQCLKDQTRQDFQVLSHEFGKLPLIDACVIEIQTILTYEDLR